MQYLKKYGRYLRGSLETRPVSAGMESEEDI